ncbi:M23 family metallopeptidase [Nocardia huaxiensis]|uniref:M23 family metallopeptidase n=1 Tax=Nocardia huaxiensis TaxID=2755382 RepID=UPI0030B859A0
MSDGPFPSPSRARHGHRYREEAGNYGGATHFDAPQTFDGQVSHGGWGTGPAWTTPAEPQWDAQQQWEDPAAAAQWNDGTQWDNGASTEWDAAPEWNSGEQWQSQPEWDTPVDDQSAWDSRDHWSTTSTTNGWAAPNPADYSPRPDWGDDPAPSGDYRPAYTFRTASGEKLTFSGDGARLDKHDDEHADSEAAQPRPTRAGGRRRAAGGGAHRLPAPPTALKGRAAVVAVAAGAVVAAGQTGIEVSGAPSDTVDFQAAAQVKEIAANETIGLADAPAAGAPQVLNVGAPVNIDQFNDILEKGARYAADLAAAEAAKLRPLFSKFANGNFTSGFGMRWGVQHAGVDVAAPIGTPIYAVADGTVLEAGPASGFGMWVRLLHDDGTVTIYGHIDTATVSQGQRVMAGDQIATVGNRGFSTGPHCHFEVWLNGVDKIDPIPWLASRGISLGIQRD